MSTPRTDALLENRRAIDPRNEIWDVDDVQEFLKHSRQLETELAQATALLAKASEQMKADRELHEDVVDAYSIGVGKLETELEAAKKLLQEERFHFADMLKQRDLEREKVAKLRDAFSSLIFRAEQAAELIISATDRYDIDVAIESAKEILETK